VAIVVTHDRPAQVRRTVRRLLGESVDHVIVFDNGSRERTREVLAAEIDPRLVVVRSEANLGGAGGFAAAMQAARELFDPDWLVLMDDDARPLQGAVAQFRAMDRRGWDALAAAVYYPDGAICPMNRPLVNRLGRRGGFVPRHLRPRDYAGGRVRPVAASSFVGFFVSRAAVARAGLPDASLFLYAEDGLYTLGLTQAGLRLGFVPWIRFEHDCQSLATRRAGFRPLWKSYYYHRNLMIFYRRAMGPLAWPAMLYLLPRWAWKVRAQTGERRAYLRLLARAVADGLADRRDRIDGS
jgi:GT2 family glycosyltransferase